MKDIRKIGLFGVLIPAGLTATAIPWASADPDLEN